jgi:hypothetical protein
MWVLVAIAILSHKEVDAHEIGRYNTMVSCFDAREQILLDLEAPDARVPINKQFVCVRTNYK